MGMGQWRQGSAPLSGWSAEGSGVTLTRAPQHNTGVLLNWVHHRTTPGSVLWCGREVLPPLDQQTANKYMYCPKFWVVESVGWINGWINFCRCILPKKVVTIPLYWICPWIPHCKPIPGSPMSTSSSWLHPCGTDGDGLCRHHDSEWNSIRWHVLHMQLQKQQEEPYAAAAAAAAGHRKLLYCQEQQFVCDILQEILCKHKKFKRCFQSLSLYVRFLRWAIQLKFEVLLVLDDSKQVRKVVRERTGACLIQAHFRQKPTWKVVDIVSQGLIACLCMCKVLQVWMIRSKCLAFLLGFKTWIYRQGTFEYCSEQDSWQEETMTTHLLLLTGKQCCQSHPIEKAKQCSHHFCSTKQNCPLHMFDFQEFFCCYTGSQWVQTWKWIIGLLCPGIII